MKTKKCAPVRIFISIILMFLFNSTVFAVSFRELCVEMVNFLERNEEKLCSFLGSEDVLMKNFLDYETYKKYEDSQKKADIDEKKKEKGMYLAKAKVNATKIAKGLSKKIKLFLEAQEANDNFSAKVGASYSMNESNSVNMRDDLTLPDTKLYSLNIDVEISKGIFPKIFNFKVTTATQYKESELTESLNNIQVGYGRYFKNFNMFCFADRFSDIYLGIQQRYEIGTGIKGEAEFFRPKNNPHFEKLKQDIDDFVGYFYLPEGETQNKKIAKERDSLKKTSKSINETIGDEQLKKDISSITQCYKKKNAIFLIGLDAIFFVEIERSEIDTYLDEPNSSEEDKKSAQLQKFVLDAVQSYRYAGRLTVESHLSDNLALKGQLCRKYKLGDHLHDTRTDINCIAEYKLGEPGWAKKVSLVAEYIYHYINKPAMLTPPDGGYDGKIPRFIFANNKHEKLQIKFVAEF